MNMVNPAVDTDTLCRQASSFLDSGRVEAARALLAAARALNAGVPDLTLLEVRLALSGGELDRAIQMLDAAVTDMPGYGELWKSRAEIRNRVGDWEGAARDAAEAVALDSADPDAKALLGSALLNLNLPKPSIACLREAVSAAPANASYRELLSRAYEKSGDVGSALSVLNDGIAAGQAQVGLFNAAILLHARSRDFTRVVELAEQARAAGVADACTFSLKGRALCSLERHDEAALAYQEALKLAPNDPDIRHLAVTRGSGYGADRARAEFPGQTFERSVDQPVLPRVAFGPTIPALIRAELQQHPRIAAGLSLGPALDLGCGAGLVAMALNKLPVGPLTGVDASPNMLAQARAKRLYAELRQADVNADLQTRAGQWPLIIAADIMSNIGDLRDVLSNVSRLLSPDGWYIFSIELLPPARDGTASENVGWAPRRQGRYAHAHDYIYESVGAAGLRILRQGCHAVGREAGVDVAGLLLVTAQARQ